MKPRKFTYNKPIPLRLTLMIFSLAFLALAALIWMGVEGMHFPTWLLALAAVL